MGRRRAGLGDFTPGLESAKAAGIKAERIPYPAGDAGIQLSLETVAKRIYEGSLDPGIIELAHKIFVAAGFSGRGSSAGTTRERIHALLEYVRSWLIYAPDQPGTERIATAAALACIRPGLCIRIADCDEQVLLLGSLLGAAGIPVRVVKQDYGGSHQQHVLVEAFDDGAGTWLYADPSTNMPLGTAAAAMSEQRVDPLDLKIEGAGTSGAELITLGRPPPMASQMTRYQGRWWHRDGLGRVSFHDGASWHPVALNHQRGVGAIFGCEYAEAKTFRIRLIGPWHALAQDVADCTGLTIDQKTAFKFDYASFSSWYNNIPQNQLFCDDAEAADIRAGRDHEARLDAWRRIVDGAKCVTSEPDLPPLADDDPRNPNYDLSHRPTTASEIKNVITTVAIIGAVGVGVYITMPLLRAGAEALAGAVKKKRVTAR